MSAPFVLFCYRSSIRTRRSIADHSRINFFHRPPRRRQYQSLARCVLQHVHPVVRIDWLSRCRVMDSRALLCSKSERLISAWTRKAIGEPAYLDSHSEPYGNAHLRMQYALARCIFMAVLAPIPDAFDTTPTTPDDHL